jgi:hypothetical protein
MLEETFLNAGEIKQDYGFAYTPHLFNYMGDFKKYMKETRETDYNQYVVFVCLYPPSTEFGYTQL